MSSIFDSFSNKVVVLQPHLNSKIVSNTRTISDIIDTSKQGFYSILTNPELNKCNTLEFKISKKYKICGTGLIKKITLIDFPTGQYFLRANGWNIATASYDNDQYVFNIDNPKKSKQMSQTIKLSMKNDNIDDNDYLNIGNLDNFEILATVPLTEKKIIKLEGLFYKKINDIEQLVHDKIDYEIYPKEQSLTIYNPVKELLFFHKCYKEYKLSIRLNGYLYGPYNSSNGIIRIGFEGFDKIINGSQNDFLSDEHNKTTLNCSIIDYIGVVSDIDELSVIDYSYVTHNLLGNRIFS